MVGGTDYQRPPVQPRHPGRAPARLDRQAVHPRDGAEEGLRPRVGVDVAQARLRRPEHRRQEKFVVNNFDNSYSGSRDLGSALTVLRQLGVRGGRHRDRARSAIAKLDRADGHPHARLAQPGDDARRLQAGRHGARLGARVRVVRHRRRAGLGLARSAGPRARRHPGRAHDRLGQGPHAQQACTAQRVLSGAHAARPSQQMQTVVSSGTGKRAAYGGFAAGKTGTTENFGDAWFVGLHRSSMTIAVWVGYPDKLKPMKTEFDGEPVAGGTFPAQIWHDFVVQANAIFKKRIADRQASATEGRPSTTTRIRRRCSTRRRRSGTGGTGGTDATGAGTGSKPAAPAGPATGTAARRERRRWRRRPPNRRRHRRTHADTPAPAPTPTPAPAPTPASGGTGGAGRRRQRAVAAERRGSRRPRPRDAAAVRPRRSATAGRRPCVIPMRGPATIGRAGAPRCTGASIRTGPSTRLVPLQLEIDAERLRELARARSRDRAPRSSAAPRAHQLEPVARLERADQHRRARRPRASHDRVEQRVDAVGAVDVGDARRPEQGAGARASARRRRGTPARRGGRPPSRRSRPERSPWRDDAADQVARDLARPGGRRSRAGERSGGHQPLERPRASSSCSRTRASDVPPSETFDSSQDERSEHAATLAVQLLGVGARAPAARSPTASGRSSTASRTRPATIPWHSRNGTPAPDEQVGDVGRRDQLVRGGVRHPLAVEGAPRDHARRRRRGSGAACRPRRTGAPCPPAGPCCRSAAARASRRAAPPGGRRRAAPSRAAARRRRGSSSAA